jgi:hypothetical protein
MNKPILLMEDERTRLLPVDIMTSSRVESDLIRGYRGGALSLRFRRYGER